MEKKSFRIEPTREHKVIVRSNSATFARSLTSVVSEWTSWDQVDRATLHSWIAQNYPLSYSFNFQNTWNNKFQRFPNFFLNIWTQNCVEATWLTSMWTETNLLLIYSNINITLNLINNSQSILKWISWLLQFICLSFCISCLWSKIIKPVKK